MTQDQKETFMTLNSDGSVSFDPYADKTRDELKARCAELIQSLGAWHVAAVYAAMSGGNRLENVPEPYRSKIKRMIDAYGDASRVLHTRGVDEEVIG